MFKNKFVLGIIALGVIAATLYMFSSAPTYAEKFENDLEKYKQELVAGDNAPLANIGTRGVSFFDPDEKWVFEADFLASEDNREFKLDMTDSSTESAKLAGYATFRKDGQAYTLFVFDEGAQYVVPFKDGTNGNETYGGGRYINIGKGQLVGKKLTIDFNKSRNYYCAYNEDFICPIPPRENILPIAVNAGEKNYQL